MSKTIAALIVFIFALVACARAPESSVRAGVEFKVDTLFTHDGCTVYRFMDAGNLRYFTNCSGQTSWSESSGKSSRKMEIVGGKSAE